ncbi:MULTISPECIES: hypothetical protein [unclassified Sphingopyxis]|uniref:hypothetical protein n=1 Tax=unclassified Sphingopyxis TaxID=2614943 RepID=UPI000735F1AF|nr:MULTISPECIES: hypothetical protein [unclassified Sphingopyxis]KTE37422.1 hypothetical protein ATE62_13845 [Sphingopyxis sp. HIX]KTE85522.1 hypothetical protein ATE72_03480 [Sphingopyxis sp. HXXIV]
MAETIQLPRLILGPLSRGRNFGVVGRSPVLPIDDAAVGGLSGFNHNMVFQVGPGVVMHSLMPVPGSPGIWFLSTTRGDAPIDGNPVVTTSGVLMSEDAVRQMHGRADRLVGPWLEDRAMLTPSGMIPAAVVDIPQTPSGREGAGADVAAFLPLLGIVPVRFHDAARHATDDERSAYALRLIGNLLAAAPFDRATTMSWSTLALPGTAWSLSVAPGTIPEEPDSTGTVDIGFAPGGGLAIRSGADIPAIERCWLALAQAVSESRHGSDDHARALDGLRGVGHRDATPADTLHDRGEAMLAKIAAGFGPDGVANWLRLLVDAARTVRAADDVKREIGVAVGRLVEHYLVDGAANHASLSMLRRELLSQAPATLTTLGIDQARLVRAGFTDPDPLLLFSCLDEAGRDQWVAELPGSPGASEASMVALYDAADRAAARALDRPAELPRLAALVRDLLREAREHRAEEASGPALQGLASRLARLGYAPSVDPALREDIRASAEMLFDHASGGSGARRIFQAGLHEPLLARLREAHPRPGAPGGAMDAMARTDAMIAYLRHLRRMPPVAVSAAGGRRS